MGNLKCLDGRKKAEITERITEFDMKFSRVKGGLNRSILCALSIF